MNYFVLVELYGSKMHIIDYTWSVWRSPEYPWQLAGVTTAILTKHAEFWDAVLSLRSQRGGPRTFLAERGGERRGGGRQLGARTNARGEHGTAVGARSLTSDQWRRKSTENILIIHSPFCHS